MPNYVIGDDKCDLCGEKAVYRLWIEKRYLKNEYCRAHRWIGIINADPMSKVMNALFGAAVFGVIYAVLSLLARTKRRGLDDSFEIDERVR